MEATAYTDMAQVQDTHWWYRARRRILASVIAGFPLPEKAKILEVGCGPGGNLAMLDKFGDVCALEPYGPAADIARTRGNWLIKPGSLPEPIGFDGPFDVIAAFDVIEHVEQDIPALAAIATRLAANGTFIMTVPAYQWLWSAHDVHNHHFRRYDRRGLTVALEQAGFVVERISYFNSFLFPLIAGVRLVQKTLGLASKAEDATPGPFANTLLEHIFSAEAGLLKVLNFPFGVSLIAIAKRKN
jgi:SAM-dependent methyltransferase